MDRIRETRRQKLASMEDHFRVHDGGVDNEKAIIHAKRWEVYMNKKKALIKGDCSV